MVSGGDEDEAVMTTIRVTVTMVVVVEMVMLVGLVVVKTAVVWS